MYDLKTLFTFILSLYKIDFTIYGYTFNFWAILVWLLLGSFVLWFIVKFFNIGGD